MIDKELVARVETLIAAMDLSVNVPASRHLPIIAHDNAAVIAQDLRALLTAAQGQEWRDLPTIRERAENLKEWLQDNAPYISVDQRHLDADTVERAYWHYGYMVALRDTLASFDKAAHPPNPSAVEG